MVVKLAKDFDAAALTEGEKARVFVAEKVAHEGFVLIVVGEPVEATFLVSVPIAGQD